MNAPRTTERRIHEQGIALVIVLGFLAIMTIMAVSFTINMRTERLTSRMYLDTVRSRQFIDMALSRALSDLDFYLNDAPPLPAPDFDYWNIPGGNSSNVILYKGVVTNLLPIAFASSVTAADLKYITNQFNSSTPIVGEYSYTVINLTGFLDMNHVGAADARGKGRSPSEIRIDPQLISEAGSVGAWSTFASNLSNSWRRIETVQEFVSLTGIGSSPILNTIRGSRNFFPASRSLVELRPGTTDYKIDIGGSKTNLIQNKNNIVQGFRDSFLSDIEAEDAYNQLLDFIDTDIIPENQFGLSAEPVPMINEIAASGTLIREVIPDPPDTYRFILRNFKVSIELWYPFPINENTPESFRVSTNIGIVFTPVASGNQSLRDLRAQLIPSTNSADATISPAFIEVDRRGFVNSDGVPYVVELSYPEKQYTVTDPIFSAAGAANANLIDLAVQINTLDVLYGDDLVDRVQNPGVGFNVRIKQNNFGEAGIACRDPRLNHKSGLKYWNVESSPTLGRINPFNTNNIPGQITEAISTNPVFYCRNFPLGLVKSQEVGLGSVAELGYLSLGEPWRTIALYDRPNAFTLNPVLDHFTVSSPSNSMHGLVNLNSRITNVLASVFFDQPIDAAPEIEPVVARLDVSDAVYMATSVMHLAKSQPIDSLSKLGKVTGLFNYPSLSSTLYSDALIESVVRNSVNLFTTRQNIFGIILHANTLSPDGSVTASDRAFAVVWRDPVAINGVNETIIRYFTWLSED